MVEMALSHGPEPRSTDHLAMSDDRIAGTRQAFSGGNPLHLEEDLKLLAKYSLVAPDLLSILERSQFKD